MKISTSMWKSEHILSSRVLHVIHICYSPAGRSVLGETVHEVLSTARDRRPRAVLRPRAHFLPVRTDLDRWRTFLFFFLRRFKSFRKILLQPTTYVCWRRARWFLLFKARDRLQTKTLQHDFWTLFILSQLSSLLE